MSSDRDFISQVCVAFKKAVEKASGVTLEGRERQFRHILAQHLFGKILEWEEHYKIGEIYDIACFDDEDFPVIIIETKWDVELTSEIKEKLRKRIEELGSVKYGVFASERKFVVYVFEGYKLRELTKVNVAEAIGVAKGEYGLSELGKRRILKLETLKRERLVWVEAPDYFEKTYKEISVAKVEGVKLLTENLKEIIRGLTTVLMDFFDSYIKRKDHYSGRFLENTFNDWLRLSMKDEDFKKGNENERRKIIEVFCRETAYVLVGRMFFIRMCEDKEILEPSLSGKRLAEFLRFYERRKENVYLRAFYDSREEIKKYYSHLHELGFFDWWWISPEKRGALTYDNRREQDRLEEDLNHQIKKCLRRLNRFDFTQVNRDILGDVYQGYLPPDERKRLGEFYTPKEVIEYILDAVGYKPENKEIGVKKILDPACGSGSFLVEATQRLIERYGRVGFRLKNPDDCKQIIDGCINSIYGLDIHPFACFIAEMNLLFQLVDLYDVVKQKDRYYKLPRLNIFRTDSLALSEEPIKLADFLDNSRRVMLIEETKGADRVKNTKFDYVVGNPPYVRKERIPVEYKEKILEKAYPEIYHGDNDICVYFIAKGISWLKEKGKFGYIVSGKFTKVRYGEKLRGYIPDHCRIEQFLDFRGVKIFRDVTNDPIILILGKEASKEQRERNNIKNVYVKEEKASADELMECIKENIGKEWYADEIIDIFNSPQALIGRDVWKLVPKKIDEVYRKIKQNSDYPLETVCDVFYGIKPGKVDVLVVDEEKAKKLNLERNLLKPVLRGEDVRRYRIDYKDTYLIFPYLREDGKYVTVDIKSFPSLERYLSQYKEELANRYDIRKSKSKWYELRPCNYYYVFEAEKILTPDISEKNNFAYDKVKYYCLDTCFIVLPKEEHEHHIYYYLGLLNSKVMEFYFKQIGGYLGRKGYRYKKQYLDQLPIKEVTDENKHLANEVTQTVDQILRLNEQISIIKRKIEDFPNSYFEDGWSFDKLANIIKTQSISRESYAVSEKFPRTDYLLKDLDGKETFRIILAPEEYVDFNSEQVASYVLEVLKTKNLITKRELLELKIPAQPHLKNLMNQYRKDKEQIVKNEKAVEELAKQIDDLVYKLYDVTHRERRIIEDYLTKF